jgi:putative endonuclease
MKALFVYITANRCKGAIYIGVTSNLAQRAFQHRESVMPGFTARYGVKRLVWLEAHDNAEAAIRREKRLKEWPRLWKVALIEKANPDWRDLYSEIVS